MLHRLRFVAALTFVRIALVNRVEVGPEANLACTHLCDYRANCPVDANVRVEYRLPWSHPELKETLGASGCCPNLSVGQCIILKLIAFLDQSPFANWVTIQEYREGFVTAGYTRESIEIRDISENVLGQLAGCLKKTELEVEQHGLSIGQFQDAAWMFDWWCRTGVVKGYIAVARK